MRFRTVAKKIENALADIPRHWDGKQVILEMKNADFPHWRQME